jgi:hypothetical protein
MTQSPSSVAPVTDGATVIAIEDAVNPFVKTGVAVWQSLRGDRKFPARADLTLRAMAPFLPYAVIIAVIEDGADFEFRFVGEAQRQAFHTYFKGMRVSQIEAAAPDLGALLRGAYELARASGTPFAVRGRVDHEPAGSKFLYHESVFLPLGTNDTAVDHLLVVGVQIPEPFWKIPESELTDLADKIRPQVTSHP